MDTDRDGNSMSMDKLCDKGIKCTPLTKPENVIGGYCLIIKFYQRTITYIYGTLSYGGRVRYQISNNFTIRVKVYITSFNINVNKLQIPQLYQNVSLYP